MMKKSYPMYPDGGGGLFLYLAPAHAQRNLALYSMPYQV